MINEHPIDDLAAYALDVLEADEHAAVARHIAQCTLCSAEVRDYTLVAATARGGIALEPAPAGGWEQIAAQLPRPDRQPLPLAARRNHRALYLIAGWVSTAAVLAGVIVWLAWGSDGSSSKNTQADADSVAALARAGNISVIPLAGTNPGAAGRMYISEDGQQGGLAVTGLPAVNEDTVYQVWFVRRDQTRASGGIFTVDSTGDGLLTLAIPGAIRDFEGVVISQEPAGGAPDQWGDDMLSGPVYEK